MKETVGEAVAKRLAEWGVDTVFGLPGDGINGLMEGFRRVAGGRRASSSFTTKRPPPSWRRGYAKATGRLGRLLRDVGTRCHPSPERSLRRQARPRPGAGADGDAGDVGSGDSLPAGGPSRSPVPGSSPPTTSWSRIRSRSRPSSTSPIRNALRAADGRAPDVPERHPGGAGRRRIPTATSRPRPADRAHPEPGRVAVQPDAEQLARAAEILNAGRTVAVLVGAGALHAREEVIAVADASGGADRQDSARARRSFPTTIRSRRAGSDCSARTPSEELMEDCDTLLMVGNVVPLHEAPPLARADVRVVQIDVDPPSSACGCRSRPPSWPTPSCALAALLPLLRRRSTTAVPREGQQAMDEWRTRHGALENADATSDRPAVPHALRRRRRKPRCHLDVRFGHDRHVGGAPLDDPRRPAVLPVRQSRHDGPGLALCHRHATRLSRSAGDRLRRRRRFRHADGGVPHRGAQRVADQGRDQQQQQLWADPVGADRARLSRVRRSPSRTRRQTSRRGRWRAADSVRRSRTPPQSKVRSGTCSPTTVLASWTATSIRTSHRCRPR